mgnify:CR=1 FL=1
MNCNFVILFKHLPRHQSGAEVGLHEVVYTIVCCSLLSLRKIF